MKRTHQPLSRWVLLVFLWGGPAVQHAVAQVAIGEAALQTVATFQSARAFDADLVGNLYVLDGSAGTLVKIDSAGEEIAVWGGPGSGDTQFDEPMDVEATNGLELFVADAGNRRIKRFSGEFVPLESIPLGGQAGVAAVGETRSVQPEFADLEDGRPIGVALAADGGLYALDADRNVVLKWTRTRRLERIFGGYDAPEGALIEPVALALAPDGRVMIADPSRRSVAVYSQFGSFLRTIGGGQLTDVRNLSVYPGGLVVVLPHELRHYSFSGSLEERYVFDIEEPLMDAAVVNRRLYVLTATELYRVRLN